MARVAYGLSCAQSALRTENVMTESTPDRPTSATLPGALATLGGGCFWCLEAVYDDLRGVTAVESGYSGGARPNPSYEQVCAGASGHAEVVRVWFDPEQLSFREILEVFFAIHDPTTLNRQGNDVGSQYRSVIFCHDEAQQETARTLIDELTRDEVFRDPIVTQVMPVAPYYPAEQYHQNYFRDHPGQGYCMAVVAPKLVKFRKRYANRLKSNG